MSSPPNVELWLESQPNVPDNLNLVYYTAFSSPYPTRLVYDPNVDWDYAVVYWHTDVWFGMSEWFAYSDAPEYDGILNIYPSSTIGIRNVSFYAEPTVVPEPATMFLLGLGLIGLAGYGRKKFSKK
jgi:hypothetical protein